MINEINKKKVPAHVAIIMDGNGRWAKNKNHERVFGHKNAADAVRNSLECAAEIGVKVLTLYAFSTENWNRPKFEVDTLMNLLSNSLTKELPRIQENDVKIIAIGDLQMLPKKLQKKLIKVIEKTKNNKKITLNLALSYGARQEIVEAFRKIVQQIKNNDFDINSIDEQAISKHLYTANLPNLDLMIRTGAEQRISNFMLWQSAYAELYFTEVLWPDFSKEDFLKAIVDYQKRQRRFGTIS